MVDIHCIGGCGKIVYTEKTPEPRTFMCKECTNKFFEKEIKDIKKEEKHAAKKSKT